MTGKATVTISVIAMFVSALIISFIKDWIPTLVFPAQILILRIMSVGAEFTTRNTVQSIEALLSSETYLFAIPTI